MSQKRKALSVLMGTALIAVLFVMSHPRAQFEVGGAFINVGLKLQDGLHAYDFEHGRSDITPEQVWAEFVRQNDEASTVRKRFPRSTEHPLVAMLVCMDARLDTTELSGDARQYYYVVRTAGSILDVEEQEMLELAVRNGVKVLVLTRHTDCAAEKVAADPQRSKQYPALSAAVDERRHHLEAFLARPLIAERITKGELLVKTVMIDTHSERLLIDEPASLSQAPASPALDDGL